MYNNTHGRAINMFLSIYKLISRFNFYKFIFRTRFLFVLEAIHVFIIPVRNVKSHYSRWRNILDRSISHARIGQAPPIVIIFPVLREGMNVFFNVLSIRPSRATLTSHRSRSFCLRDLDCLPLLSPTVFSKSRAGKSTVCTCAPRRRRERRCLCE